MDQQKAADLLGVEVDASEQEIKCRYRELVKDIHPDQGGSSECFKQVQKAKNELLIDEGGSVSSSNGNIEKTQHRKENYKKSGTSQSHQQNSTDSSGTSYSSQREQKSNKATDSQPRDQSDTNTIGETKNELPISELKFALITIAKAGRDGIGVVLISVLVLMSADTSGLIASETAKAGLYLTFFIAVVAMLRRVWVYSNKFNRE